MEAEDFLKAELGQVFDGCYSDSTEVTKDIAILMEAYAEIRSSIYKVEHISANTLINSVLPENSVLFKDGHECWHFWYDDTAFMEDEEPMFSKEVHENFATFVRRIISSLIEREGNLNGNIVYQDLVCLQMES